MKACEVKLQNVSTSCLVSQNSSLVNCRFLMIFYFRMELIGVYCKSVNKELQPNTIRIRQKPISRLEEMKNDVSIIRKGPSENYISVLPVMGFNSLNEHYIINSLLFLKTNHSKLFY